MIVSLYGLVPRKGATAQRAQNVAVENAMMGSVKKMLNILIKR